MFDTGSEILQMPGNRRGSIFSSSAQFTTFQCRILFYTISQKKGCHPNHGYNFVNSWIDLQNSFTAAKTTKFPTKPILGYPAHLKYIAALP